MDPGFEIGRCMKCARKHVEKFSVEKFSVSHSLSSPQPGLGTLDITWN